MHTPPPDDLVLDRYLAGELSGDELVALESWLRANPGASARIRALPGAAFGTAVAPDTDASWQALATRINTTDDLASRRETSERVTRPRWSARAWMRVAAAAVLVISGGVVWRLSATAARGGELDAPLGREMTATLPDGSRLTLAAGSHASWTASYGSTAREIRLEGEALFDVVHDAARPFQVRTRDAVAEDIGTRFVVRAWPELSSVEVAVEEGIVALTDTAQASSARRTLLRAGDRGRLEANGQVTVTTDADAVLAWTHGQLAFENEPLRIALPAIGRRFAVTLRADSAIVSRRLTARFAAQSLPEVLDALALALDVKVVTTGNVITLTPPSR